MDETPSGNSVTPERFAQVREVFEAAIERPGNERRAFLAAQPSAHAAAG